MNKDIISIDIDNRGFKSILESMPGAFLIYSADENEEIIYVNKEVIDIFECENPDQFMELTGGTFKNMIHKLDFDRVERNRVSDKV